MIPTIMADPVASVVPPVATPVVPAVTPSPSGITTPPPAVPVAAVVPAVVPAVTPVVPVVAAELKLDKVDGFPADETARIAALAKELGWSQEVASKHHAAEAQRFAADVEAIKREQAQQTNDWIAKNKSHPEFGGAKYDQTNAEISKVLARFDTDGGLTRDLAVIGSDKPEIRNFLARVAYAMGDGKFVQAGNQTQVSSKAATADEAYAKRLKR